jgi:hypothetical protein
MPSSATNSERQWMIDRIVFYAWGGFGSEVGWRRDKATLRLTKPDAIAFIRNNFRHVVEYGVML